jgi:hypothetical protein
MKLSRLVVAGGLLLVLAILAATALARGGNGYVVENAKHGSGPWKTNSQRVKIKQGKSKNLFVRIKNGSGATRSVTLNEDGAVGPPDYHYSWFKGKDDISHDVQTSGYDFSLKGHKKKKFRIRATANNASAKDCVFGRFSVDGDGGVSGGFRINTRDCPA